MGLISDDAKAATARGAAATNTTDALAAEAGPALPWLSQFVILLKRCFLAHRLDLVDPMLLANMFSVMLLSAALWSGQGQQETENRDVGADISGIAVSVVRLLGLPAHDPRFIYISGRSRRGDEGARRGALLHQRLFFSTDIRGHSYHQFSCHPYCR